MNHAYDYGLVSYGTKLTFGNPVRNEIRLCLCSAVVFIFYPLKLLLVSMNQSIIVKYCVRISIFLRRSGSINSDLFSISFFISFACALNVLQIVKYFCRRKRFFDVYELWKLASLLMAIFRHRRATIALVSRNSSENGGASIQLSNVAIIDDFCESFITKWPSMYCLKVLMSMLLDSSNCETIISVISLKKITYVIAFYLPLQFFRASSSRSSSNKN